MTNKFTLLIAFLLITLSVSAQKNTVQLISSSENETILSFKINSYEFKDVKTPKGIEKIIISDNTSEILKKGFPDLPKFSESIIIPDMGNTKIEVISSDFYELEDISIAPSKGNFTRDIDPATIPYEYGAVYKQDDFFPQQTAELGSPYIVRDYRGQAVYVHPFAYNPVKKILRVYTEIKVKVTTLKQRGINEFIRNKSFTSIDKEFKQIYSSHFINFQNTKYTPVEEEGNMLIICYDDWTDEMQALVDWKNKIGRPTEMVTVTEAGGNAAAIKTFVQNYYNTNGLTYLLLVGDAAQVPTNSGGGLGGDSDNAYAYITGNDHYLEFFVGRFSAENTAQVTTQIQRTISYENGSTLADGWLNKTMGVASSQGDGQGDDDESDFVHYRNMATDLLGFTYDYSFENFDGSQGGNDASGDPTPTMVGNDINNGVGIINYTGHGSTTSWGTSGFSVTEINNLTNVNKLPFIFDVACVNGDFNGQTCFGEAWLRAEHNGEPAGAVAICASTINQSWAPPMAAQDEMVDLLVGTSLNGIKRTYTGIVVNGMFQMNEEYSDYNMTDTWTSFGDPSLYVRTDNPSDMVISHNSVVIVGSSNFDVTCDFNGALACISYNNQIIGTANVSGGIASIPVSGLTPGETLTLALTGFNKVSYFASLNVISPSGPYMVVENYNNTVDYGQSINLDISLKNVGSDPATGISATVSTSDPNASISNPSFTYGDVAAGATTSAGTGVFTLTVNDDIIDQYMVPVNISITDGTNTWEYTKNVIVNAPAISIGDVFVTGDNSGDGRLDPGETGNINFTITNSGHAVADFNGTLSESSDPNNYLTLGGTTLSGVNLAAGDSQDFTFTGASADAATPLGSSVGLQIAVTAGASNQYTASDNQDLIIGIIPVYLISTGGTLTVCTGTFYDSGGEAGSYQNNEDYTMTFLPGTGEDFVVAEFTSFETENTYDKLYVYDGPDINSPQVTGGPFTGTSSPGTLMGANGLTFKFTSDGSVTKAGWAANISCYTATEPPACATNPTPANNATNVFPTSVSWATSMGATSYDVYFGTDATVLNNPVTNVTSSTMSVSCTPTTQYYWAVVPKNDIGSAAGCETWTFTTGAAQYLMSNGTITTCDGVFYDSGGASGNYQNNEDYTMTFMPGEAGKMIKAVFDNGAVIEGGYDYLYAYDGSTTSATQFAGSPWSNSSGVNIGTLLASNPDGAITFKFTSDGTVTKAGWRAVISCENGISTYTITFNVTDGTNPIQDAAVTFNGTTINTDASGNAVFEDVPEANGMVYSVSKNGLNTATGTVDVDADKTVTVIMTPNSINELVNNIKIVPNPSNGVFTIDFGALNTTETSVKIMSVSGQTVYESNRSANVHEIDLSRHAKGIYFVKINSGEFVYNTKLMIK